jgi:hypothetical protein
MFALRHPSSRCGIIGQHVSVNHGDGGEKVREHPGGEQTAHTRTENDCTPG